MGSGAADDHPAGTPASDIQEGELDNPAMLIRKDGKPVLSNIKGNWDELNLVRCGHSPLRRPPLLLRHQHPLHLTELSAGRRR